MRLGFYTARAVVSLTLCAAGVALALVGPARADDLDTQGTPDFQWSAALKSGQTVEIKGVNGHISATPSSSGKVEIQAWKKARRSDPNEVKIELIPHAGGITVCSVYPTPFGSPKNDCEPGENGHMSTRNNDVAVHYLVRIPAGIGFTARDVNGGVEAHGLSGPINAFTVNGSVEISTSSHAEARTVNGHIRAVLGATQWNEPLQFQTVNGGIDVDLMPTVNANLDATTVNGSIDSELPWTMHGRIGRHHMQGTINKGGSQLKLQTVNGSIRIGAGT